jgi:hypothetical protein
MKFHDIPVMKDIVLLHPLAGEFRGTPYAGIFEVPDKILMDQFSKPYNRRASGEGEWRTQVGFFARLF